MFQIRDAKVGTKTVFTLPPAEGKADGWLPWAMNSVNQVIYARYKDIKSEVSPTMTIYTAAMSQTRRRRCQTALAHYATINRTHTNRAVIKVSLGIIDYLAQGYGDGQVKKDVAAHMGRYMYSDAGYGRLGQPSSKPASEDLLYETALKTLSSGTASLPSILAIHDFMGRKVFDKHKGTEGQNAFYASTGSLVRPAHMFGSADSSPEALAQLRGRTERAGAITATSEPGVLSPGTAPASIAPYQTRARGIDRWEPSTGSQSAFSRDLSQRNLVFGAGPSGSTGTLLQAGMVFGNLDEEDRKQYALAIVAYLVGGGMHSYHEVMSICSLANCPYAKGSFDTSLPNSFKSSQDYKVWISEYYDIAVLGGRLWILN